MNHLSFQHYISLGALLHRKPDIINHPIIGENPILATLRLTEEQAIERLKTECFDSLSKHLGFRAYLIENPALIYHQAADRHPELVKRRNPNSFAQWYRDLDDEGALDEIEEETEQQQTATEIVTSVATTAALGAAGVGATMLAATVLPKAAVTGLAVTTLLALSGKHTAEFGVSKGWVVPLMAMGATAAVTRGISGSKDVDPLAGSGAIANSGSSSLSSYQSSSNALSNQVELIDFASNWIATIGGNRWLNRQKERRGLSDELPCEDTRHMACYDKTVRVFSIISGRPETSICVEMADEISPEVNQAFFDYGKESGSAVNIGELAQANNSTFTVAIDGETVVPRGSLYYCHDVKVTDGMDKRQLIANVADGGPAFYLIALQILQDLLGATLKNPILRKAKLLYPTLPGIHGGDLSNVIIIHGICRLSAGITYANLTNAELELYLQHARGSASLCGSYGNNIILVVITQGNAEYVGVGHTQIDGLTLTVLKPDGSSVSEVLLGFNATQITNFSTSGIVTFNGNAVTGETVTFYGQAVGYPHIAFTEHPNVVQANVIKGPESDKVAKLAETGFFNQKVSCEKTIRPGFNDGTGCFSVDTRNCPMWPPSPSSNSSPSPIPSSSPNPIPSPSPVPSSSSSPSSSPSPSPIPSSSSSPSPSISPSPISSSSLSPSPEPSPSPVPISSLSPSPSISPSPIPISSSSPSPSVSPSPIPISSSSPSPSVSPSPAPSSDLSPSTGPSPSLTPTPSPSPFSNLEPDDRFTWWIQFVLAPLFLVSTISATILYCCYRRSNPEQNFSKQLRLPIPMGDSDGKEEDDDVQGVQSEDSGSQERDGDVQDVQHVSDASSSEVENVDVQGGNREAQQIDGASPKVENREAQQVGSAPPKGENKGAQKKGIRLNLKVVNRKKKGGSNKQPSSLSKQTSSRPQTPQPEPSPRPQIPSSQPRQWRRRLSQPQAPLPDDTSNKPQPLPPLRSTLQSPKEEVTATEQDSLTGEKKPSFLESLSSQFSSQSLKKSVGVKRSPPSPPPLVISNPVPSQFQSPKEEVTATDEDPLTGGKKPSFLESLSEKLPSPSLKKSVGVKRSPPPPSPLVISNPVPSQFQSPKEEVTATDEDPLTGGKKPSFLESLSEKLPSKSSILSAVSPLVIPESHASSSQLASQSSKKLEIPSSNLPFFGLASSTTPPSQSPSQNTSPSDLDYSDKKKGKEEGKEEDATLIPLMQQQPTSRKSPLVLEKERQSSRQRLRGSSQPPPPRLSFFGQLSPSDTGDDDDKEDKKKSNSYSLLTTQGNK